MSERSRNGAGICPKVPKRVMSVCSSTARAMVAFLLRDRCQPAILAAPSAAQFRAPALVRVLANRRQRLDAWADALNGIVVHPQQPCHSPTAKGGLGLDQGGLLHLGRRLRRAIVHRPTRYTESAIWLIEAVNPSTHSPCRAQHPVPPWLGRAANFLAQAQHLFVTGFLKILPLALVLFAYFLRLGLPMGASSKPHLPSSI